MACKTKSLQILVFTTEMGTDPESGYIFRIRNWIFGRKKRIRILCMVWCI